MVANAAEVKSRKPENTPFKQQRLRAWQPILTPRTVLPTLFVIGILFAPLGGILLYISNQVSEVVVDYTDCAKAGPEFTTIKSRHNKVQIPEYGEPKASTFRYKSQTYYPTNNNPNNFSVNQCTIEFILPGEMPGPIYMYYQLTNFYQNHRRYVKSVSYNQLKGDALPVGELNTDCEPLVSDPETGKPYFPCGLIANSVFNDTIYPLKPQNSDSPYSFANRGIGWKADSDKFKKTKYNHDDVVPPPNWAKRYPEGKYSQEYPPPDVSQDEHLQVWMRTAGLPSFRKLYGKLDGNLPAGTYQVDIDLHFNTSIYYGNKYFVLSTVSILGGKNPYLGLAYLILGGICVILGLGFTIRHIMYPRKLGDNSYLSWNQHRASSSGPPPSTPSQLPITSPLAQGTSSQNMNH